MLSAWSLSWQPAPTTSQAHSWVIYQLTVKIAAFGWLPHAIQSSQLTVDHACTCFHISISTSSITTRMLTPHPNRPKDALSHTTIEHFFKLLASSRRPELPTARLAPQGLCDDLRHPGGKSCLLPGSEMVKNLKKTFLFLPLSVLPRPEDMGLYSLPYQCAALSLFAVS
ncbi:hypothetical protein H4582DRAFT_740317 [Lactarius indigo]|nr:hypothetical protein H4582DRAFT_740317 [Lactarius indigo]